MLRKIARVILLLLIVLSASIILPEYYWKIFEKYVSSPIVLYSSVVDDFVYYKSVNKKIQRYDNRGNVIQREKFDELTPLFNYRSLIYRDGMPDSIKGWEVDLKELKLNSFYINIRPDAIFDPLVPLFPLMESEPDGPQLSMPDDFCRINDRFEFIDCESNEIDEELTQSFTEALTNAGFSFPAEQFFGNPTTRKAFDEGYFITDSQKNLFHVKRVKNKPYVRKVDIPDGVEIAFIRVLEMSLREFYGLIITKTSDVYLLTMGDYGWIKLPVENYDYKTCQFKFQGNIFYRLMSIYSDSGIDAFAADRNYTLINTFSDNWENRYNASTGVGFEFLFPFSLSLTDDNSSYVDFYFYFNGLTAIPVILLSLALTFFIHRYRGENYARSWFDYLLVVFTGIYGLLAVLLIRNEYEE